MLPIKPSGSIISTWSASIFWLLLSFGYIKQKKDMKKIALITGITGQDGSYLAELLQARIT